MMVAPSGTQGRIRLGSTSHALSSIQERVVKWVRSLGIRIATRTAHNSSGAAEAGARHMITSATIPKLMMYACTHPLITP